MYGEPVGERMQAFDLESELRAGEGTIVGGQRLQRRGARLVQRVVDLAVLGVQLGIDQRPSREGEPDLVLRAPFVVEREQFVEHLLDGLSRLRGAVECGDAAVDPLDYQSHGEGVRCPRGRTPQAPKGSGAGAATVGAGWPPLPVQQAPAWKTRARPTSSA
jgi:hypothetical protein